MAKDKKIDYSKLTLGTKIPITKTETEVKTPVIVAPKAEKTEKMEKAVSMIHADKRSTKLMKPMKSDERSLRVTLDIPLSLHAQIRMKTFQDGISMKEYFLELAKKDMNI